jgi:hypothetical protein
MLRVIGLILWVASVGFAQANDWLTVPGVRVGPITAGTTGADLRRMFGAGNVKDGPIDVGEGFEEPGTTVYATDASRALEIFWYDPETRARPARIHLCQRRARTCRWRTVSGITLGTNLKTLERLNGRAFLMSGFEWDYSGTVLSRQGGKLEVPNGRLLVRLEPTKSRPPDSTTGDQDIPSSNPGMRQLNPVVYDWIVELAK